MLRQWLSDLPWNSPQIPSKVIFLLSTPGVLFDSMTPGDWNFLALHLLTKYVIYFV